MDDASVERAFIHPCDAFVAVQNHEGNAFIAQSVRAHPKRFNGCATANPWFGEAACEELKRAFQEGARMLYLAPHLQGFHISDPLVDPLIEIAAQHRVPVYVHTGTPVCAMPFQFAALAQRHPGVKFIMGHMGYSDFWYDAPEACASASNIWLETSFMDPDIISVALERVGVDRLLFGSATPLENLRMEVAKIEALKLSPEATAKILRSNALETLC